MFNRLVDFNQSIEARKNSESAVDSKFVTITNILASISALTVIVDTSSGKAKGSYQEAICLRTGPHRFEHCNNGGPVYHYTR